jgi:purine-binding chemotaxis protein CheW
MPRADDSPPGAKRGSTIPNAAENAAAAGAVRETLRQRARELASLPDEPISQGRLEVILFSLGRESYAVESRFVREVHPLKDLTPIPCTPAFVFGVINLRGELCPIIELKRLLGLPERDLSNATHAVILHGDAMELGIVADTIVGVRQIELGDILPLPATLSALDARFLRGITKDRTVILDAAGILSHPGIVVNQQIS